MTRLGDAAELLVGFAFKSAGFLDAEADGVPLLRGDNVQQGYIRWGDKTKRWPTTEFDEFERYQLAEDDVILAMDRPIVGDGLKMAWIKPEDLPCLLVQRVCRLRGVPNVALTRFIRYVIAAPEFSEHIHRITTGANIPHISGKDIAAYELTVPVVARPARQRKFRGRARTRCEPSSRPEQTAPYVTRPLIGARAGLCLRPRA